MSELKYTVYIPSHNYGRFLRDAVLSVFSQTVNDWELLLFNDGSDDDTLSIMRSFEAHPKIKIFDTGGIGLAKICNKATQAARGKYIIRLDGDDVFDKNILLVLGHALDRDDTLGLVFPDYYLVNAEGNVMGYEKREKLFSDLKKLDIPPHGACTMARVSAIREVGGYREDINAQDGYDLWSKIVQKFGSENVNLPLFYYRRHGKNLTVDNSRIFHARRQIKRDLSEQNLRKVGPIIAVIPCRRHFDFVTDLWNVSVAGETLLERQIENSLKTDLYDYLAIISDNPDTELTAKKYDDQRVKFILRESEETAASQSIMASLRQVMVRLDPEYKGITVVRYLQCPFLSNETVEEAINTLVMSDCSSVIGVEEIHSQVYKRSYNGLVPVNKTGEFRSDFDILYKDLLCCTAIYNQNIQRKTFFGGSTLNFILPRSEALAIDSSEKLELARYLSDNPVNG
jgi:glycosyltransferase involved in cell wall biosynthesis